MLERVAVLSDVHGALPALEAVLAEPDVAAADLIVLTGDIAAGPQPVEVLDLLAGLGDRACWVGGNADRELVEARAGKPCPVEVSEWAAGQLRDDQVARLAALPLTVTLPVAGLGDALFCHATPRDDEEVVLVDTRMSRWAEVFAGLPAEVTTVVCGHTHMPFTRLVDRRLVVNPGSIGMPYGGAGAWWALLGPGVQLRRTPFDVDAACARVAAESAYPDAAAWADEYLRSRHSDAAALAVFGPRDGR
ncbi:metallophosphoesterase family protein [Micromonospora sp. NPDC048830]|uniref:metallophosphoesterase family protein n=1 Tax=Micromonospora sp. NPDC048830 TaxID=3364257 RepID=UPI00370FDEFE